MKKKEKKEKKKKKLANEGSVIRRERWGDDESSPYTSAIGQLNDYGTPSIKRDRVTVNIQRE